MKLVSVEVAKTTETAAKSVVPAAILKVLKDNGFKYAKDVNQYQHKDGLTGVTIEGSADKTYHISWEWSEDGEGSDVNTYKVKGEAAAVKKLEELCQNAMSAAGDGEEEEASTEEAKSALSRLVHRVKRTAKGLYDTGHPLGNKIQEMMAEYSQLKKAGKGNSKRCKQLGMEIGKIRNSMRKKKETASETAAADKKSLVAIGSILTQAGFESVVEDTHVRFFNRAIPNTKGKPWLKAAKQLNENVSITNFEGRLDAYEILSCSANGQKFYVAFDEDGVGAASNDKNYVG